MLDTPPKLRRSRFRSASFVVLLAASSLPFLPIAAGAQTSAGQAGWSSTVVTWTNANPPPGLILPGTISTGSTGAGSVPSAGTASSVIPVLKPASPSGTAASPTNVAPLSVNGTVVRVATVSAAPDSLAVASRLALGALKDRRSLGVSPVPGLSSNGVVALMSASAPAPTVTVVDSGHGWQSTIVSTDAIESAVAKATPAAITDPEGHYAAARSQVVALVAARAKVDPGVLDQVWARTDDRRMTAVYAALAQVGTLYKYAGNAPGGFDCSGLTSYAWSVAGVKIPRISTDQINAMQPRSTVAELLPGDLVWRPGHIGMYIGVGELMVHSPRTGKPVTVEGLGKVSRMGSPF